MTAPFIVKPREHKSALGAFLPRQVGTKSANEASEAGREEGKEGSRRARSVVGPPAAEPGHQRVHFQ